MRAQEITFHKLVQGEKQFQVPLYQRTYSWRREQWERLWDDVRGLVEQQMNALAPTPHFLGSVVLAPGQVQAGGVQRWLVVDGQQRLTTLMLALTALRDHLSDTGQDRPADRINRQLLINEFHEGRDRYRLLPTQADRDAFIASVERTPHAAGGDTIGAAYRFFRGTLAEEAVGGGEGWAEAVQATLKDLLSIVEITTERGDNVYRIFESINNTGVGLSQGDLLRNHVFMMLPNRGERVYQEVWLPMQQRLGPRNLEELIWLDLVLRGHTRGAKTDTYAEQQKRLAPLAGDEEALHQVVVELADRAERLLRIIEPAREESAPLRRALERLAAWGGQIHYPLALHLLDLVDTGQATAESAAEALGHVESFLVRRMICEVQTGSLNRIIMDAPRALERDRDVAEAVHRYLSGRRRRWPNDDDVRKAVRTGPFYWRGRSSQRAQVLRWLEEAHGASEPVDFGKSKLTVEHVLPQRPSRAWLDQLAEETDEGQSPEELHSLLVHTLGNLTLTGDNAKLSNHPFERKQQILDSSALRMNREIAAAERWGRAEILARADRLAEHAVNLWPGPLATTGPADDDEWSGWSELRAALAALPSGTWTTYGAVAELIGSHPVPVGVHLSRNPGILGAFRVLTADGRVSGNFRWLEERTQTPQELLEAEGVPFDARGRAARSHQFSASDLATLLGKDVPEGGAQDLLPEAENREAAARFEAQLAQHQPEAAHAVLEVLRFWQRQGGYLNYGRSEETSCFPVYDNGTTAHAHEIWPFALYPVSGTVEVVFQYLRDRPPFDDVELRRQLLRRLNEIDGVELPEAKLELRPSFPLRVFTKHGDEVCAVLEWFVHTASTRRGEA